MKNIENLEARIIKFFGFVVMTLTTLDFFGFIPLPKTSVMPPAWQLGIAFAIGLGLLITPIDTLQGWYSKVVGKKIDKI